MIRYWQRLPLTFRQAFIYGVIGSFSFLGDFLLYALLTRVAGIFYAAANVISFTSTGFFNFLANRYFTFGHRGRPQVSQFVKFMLVISTGLLWNTGILVLLVVLTGMHDLVAKALAAVIVFFWNFGMNRWWTFRHPKEDVPIVPL